MALDIDTGSIAKRQCTDVGVGFVLVYHYKMKMDYARRLVEIYRKWLDPDKTNGQVAREIRNEEGLPV